MEKEVGELKRALFQIAMMLYNEYSKYLEHADAVVCVSRDLVEEANRFLNEPIKDKSPLEIAVKMVSDKIKELRKLYDQTKSTDDKYLLMEKINKLEFALEILKDF